MPILALESLGYRRALSQSYRLAKQQNKARLHGRSDRQL